MNLFFSLDACESCTVFAPTNSALKKYALVDTQTLVSLRIRKKIIFLKEQLLPLAAPYK